MAQARRSTKKTSRKRAAPRKRSGHNALERFNASLDEAQKALAEVTRQVGSSSRELLKELEKMLKEARKNAQRATRAAAKDLACRINSRSFIHIINPKTRIICKYYFAGQFHNCFCLYDSIFFKGLTIFFNIRI